VLADIGQNVEGDPIAVTGGGRDGGGVELIRWDVPQDCAAALAAGPLRGPHDRGRRRDRLEATATAARALGSVVDDGAVPQLAGVPLAAGEQLAIDHDAGPDAGSEVDPHEPADPTARASRAPRDGRRP